VSVKYITKNNNTDCIEVFLATINQISANTSSRRNLMLTDTMLYNVWLSGSLIWPLIKMMRAVNAISEKKAERIIISVITSFRFVDEMRIEPVPANRIFNNISNRIYL
jgi:hypothetical protein